MKKMLCLAFVAVLTGCATTGRRNKSVTLEIRPASHAPGPGLTEMTVQGTGRPVYVSGEVLLSNGDIKSARVIPGPRGPQVEIVFTKTGTERFAAVTGDNLMKPLAILVDGHVVSAPIVRDRIPGGRAVIDGRFSEEEAKRIAEGMADH